MVSSEFSNDSITNDPLYISSDLVASPWETCSESSSWLSLLQQLVEVAPDSDLLSELSAWISLVILLLLLLWCLILPTLPNPWLINSDLQISSTERHGLSLSLSCLSLAGPGLLYLCLTVTLCLDQHHPLPLPLDDPGLLSLLLTVSFSCSIWSAHGILSSHECDSGMLGNPLSDEFIVHFLN